MQWSEAPSRCTPVDRCGILISCDCEVQHRGTLHRSPGLDRLQGWGSGCRSHMILSDSDLVALGTFGIQAVCFATRKDKNMHKIQDLYEDRRRKKDDDAENLRT